MEGIWQMDTLSPNKWVRFSEMEKTSSMKLDEPSGGQFYYLGSNLKDRRHRTQPLMHLAVEIPFFNHWPQTSLPHLYSYSGNWGLIQQLRIKKGREHDRQAAASYNIHLNLHNYTLNHLKQPS